MFKQSERNNCRRRTKRQMENVERSNESSFTDVQRTCQCGSGSCEGRLVTVRSIPTDLYLFGYSAVDIFFISSTITHYFYVKLVNQHYCVINIVLVILSNLMESLQSLSYRQEGLNLLMSVTISLRLSGLDKCSSSMNFCISV